MAIYYQFLLYGAPEEEQWENVDLVKTIMDNLCIPHGGIHRVEKILKDCLQSVELNMEYNPLACYENNGAQPKIKDFDDSANVVYTALQTGMSYPQVTSLVNMARLREGKELICCSAVQNFIRKSKVIDISKRETLKSGKDDPDSDWAVASLAQMEMLKEMWRLGTIMT